jgi:hypothetical protein
MRMDSHEESLGVYRELAEHYELLGQASMRDRFLMLAADAALGAGHPAEAERLRQKLLTTNRHHMLRPYASFAEASRAADVQTYLSDLRTNYPLAEARDLLGTLRGEGAAKPPARAIPPTAPVIDLNAHAARPKKPEGPQPIYPFRDEGAPPARAPVSQPTPRPEKAAGAVPTMRPRAQPVPVPREARPVAPKPLVPPDKPAPIPLAAPLAPPRRENRDKPTKPAPRGGVWLQGLLVVVLLTTALALAAFTLARPFLPQGWLP